MKLAIAFGARGKGRALAHYEPARVVINLTKMKGAGSLAHEWGHAFDDFLGLRCGIKSIRSYLSESPVTRLLEGHPVAKAMGEVVKAMRSVDRTDEEILIGYKKEIENNGKSIRRQLNMWIKDLETEGYRRKASEKQLEEANKLADSLVASNDIEKYDSLIALYKMVKGIMPSKESRESCKYAINHIEYVTKIINKYNETGEFEYRATKSSKFYASAKKLDAHRKELYYSATCEMFARCFESYVEDTLTERGLKSQYLVHSTMSNSLYGDLQPYPEGEERQRINAAIANLVAVALQEYGSEYGKSNYSIYDNKDSIVSYRESIKTVRKSDNTEVKQDSDSANRSLNARVNSIQPEDINDLDSLRAAIVRIGGNNTERGKKIDCKAELNKLAVIGKMKLGYSGIGFLDFNKAKREGNGHSEAYIDEVTQRGRIISIDSSRKMEKALEGLIEALVNNVVTTKYGISRESAMITEGVTYAMCKSIGLDVRTYCLSRSFEALAKNKQQLKTYLNICKQLYSDINYLINR